MPALFLLRVFQDFRLVERRPFSGGGVGFLFAELVIDPDEVGKKEPKKDGPNDYPKKVVIPRRSPVDCLVIHIAPPNI
jgi:hypothetical protein